VERRRQLVALPTAEQARLEVTRVPRVRAHIQAHLAWLETEVADLDADLRRLVQASPPMSARKTPRCAVSQGSVPSSRSRCWRICSSWGDAPTPRSRPWLGSLRRVALAGRCAAAGPSGAGERRCGRAAVRAALYRGTLRTTRGNPVILTFYRRLVEAGKLKKVALVACRHKLLTILNAMVKHQALWQAQAA